MESRKVKLRVSPKFLVKNYDTNKPLDGICELIDNARDAKAKNIHINYDVKSKKLQIIDDGIGFNYNDIMNMIILGDSTKEMDIETIGSHGVGFFVANSFLLNLNETDSIKTTAISYDGEHKNGFVFICEEKNSSEILIFETEKNTRKSGTEITTDCIFLEDSDIDYLKRYISTIYCESIRNKKINIYFNSEKLKYVDMFYEDYLTENALNDYITESIIKEEYNGEEFHVKVKMVHTSLFLQTNSEIKKPGNTFSFKKEIMNEIDSKISQGASSGDHAGCYILLGGKYILMGGLQTFRHLDMRFHTYNNGFRFSIEIPLSHKRLVTAAIKSNTRKYLPEIIDKNGKKVFSKTIKFIKQHLPAKERRNAQRDSENNKIRQELFEKKDYILTQMKNLSDFFETNDVNIPSEIKNSIVSLKENFENTISKENTPSRYCNLRVRLKIPEGIKKIDFKNKIQKEIIENPNYKDNIVSYFWG